jgi:hypothetical protein
MNRLTSKSDRRRESRWFFSRFEDTVPPNNFASENDLWWWDVRTATQTADTKWNKLCVHICSFCPLPFNNDAVGTRSSKREREKKLVTFVGQLHCLSPLSIPSLKHRDRESSRVTSGGRGTSRVCPRQTRRASFIEVRERRRVLSVLGIPRRKVSFFELREGEYSLFFGYWEESLSRVKIGRDEQRETSVSSSSRAKTTAKLCLENILDKEWRKSRDMKVVSHQLLGSSLFSCCWEFCFLWGSFASLE